MKKILYIFIVLFIVSCHDNEVKYPQAVDALSAGREFIDGCLKGDFVRANAYMLQDSVNAKYFEGIKADYRLQPKDYIKTYKSASINIESVESLTDSVTIINYKNSFDHIARKVKVVNRQDGWVVDFKYTFNGNL